MDAERIRIEVSNRTVIRVMILIASFVFVLLLAYLVRRELAWFAAAFFLAVALNPAVEFFAKYIPRKSRGLSIGLVFLILLLFIGSVGASLGPPLVQQSRDLVKNVPKYVRTVEESRSPVGFYARKYDAVKRIKNLQNSALVRLSGATSSVLTVAKSVFSGLAATITILAVAFFMLLEGPNWLKQFWRIQAPRQREHNQKLAGAMYRAVTGYVTGNLLTSAIAAILTMVILAILHVPYAISLGILVGILDLLPLIGATIASIIVIVVALFNSVSAAIIMLVFFVVYQQFENHILQPIVYGRTIQMSPLLVASSAIIGASLLGVFGAIVAIPIAASLKILISDYVERRIVKHREAKA